MSELASRPPKPPIDIGRLFPNTIPNIRKLNNKKSNSTEIAKKANQKISAKTIETTFNVFGNDNTINVILTCSRLFIPRDAPKYVAKIKPYTAVSSAHTAAEENPNLKTTCVITETNTTLKKKVQSTSSKYLFSLFNIFYFL